MLSERGFGGIVGIWGMARAIASAHQITEDGADYVLALKRNQPQLHEAVETMFTLEKESEFADVDHDFHQTIEKDHGRIETRRCWVISDPDFLAYMDPDHGWSQLQSLVMVEAKRQLQEGTSYATQYFISSLPPDAKLLLHSTRSHWSIENSVHWVLSPLARTTVASVRAMHSKSWPSYAVWPLTSYAKRKAPKSVWLPNVNQQVGRQTIC